MMPLLETRDLCQRRDEQDILRNVNLSIKRGEVFALIGPSGAGKSTLLRLIDLIDLPASGKIYFNGVDTAESQKIRLEMRRRMAFVLQRPVVFNASVYDNITYGLRWRGFDNKSVHQKVGNVLETVGLSSYKNRNARTLSGGEIQRVAIARALAVEPEVLLMDEPTANLDPISASKIEELITGIIQQHSTTIIMATHDRLQGQRLADRIGVLIKGKMIQVGDTSKIFASPRTKEVAEFVGIENITDGIIVSAEDKVITIDIKGRLVEAISDYAIGEEILVCIRPEDVTLALSRVSSSARNSFDGHVIRVVTAGPLSRVEIDCGFRLVALITKKSAIEMDLNKGKQVYATFKATGVHVIKRI